MSTAEVEGALSLHPAVSEAAVVSRPHKVKGECLYCFVTLKDSREFNNTLVDELKKLGEALKQDDCVRSKLQTIYLEDFSCAVCVCVSVWKY